MERPPKDFIRATRSGHNIWSSGHVLPVGNYKNKKKSKGSGAAIMERTHTYEVISDPTNRYDGVSIENLMLTED